MNENKLPEYKSNDELPLTMNARDIAGYLNISLSCAYQVMNSRDFPVLKIGKRRIITKEHFLEWIQNASGEIL
ncbi:MAG: helix-turn-helix domain-containing protein [Oscillospiraceae bacterium]|nr:helix-turn-helix domain-containing protein [Oscillospiraceae bacterium]